jgi:hypothetical protein
LSESKFKGNALKRFRAEGYEVQCFEDKLSLGIADTFVGWPDGGIWIEWKWIDAIPARKATPLMLQTDFRPGQIIWLARFYRKPLPTCVVLGSPKGYLVVPGVRAQALVDLPNCSWEWINDKPTMGMIMTQLRSRMK